MQSKELNGCVGFIDPDSASQGRVAVKLLLDGRSRRIKFENLFEYVSAGERCSVSGERAVLNAWPPCHCDSDPLVSEGCSNAAFDSCGQATSATAYSGNAFAVEAAR